MYNFKEKNIKLFAHRGLHNSTVPENSIHAFKNAIENGYGIELDILKTKDDYLVVFHDNCLLRMCGIEKNITDCTYAEIQNLFLKNSDEHIPLFYDVLKIVNGQVPIIIEIKTDGDWIKTTSLVVDQLKMYDGDYLIESFNPLIIKYFRKKMPQIPIGQLATNMFKEKTSHSFLLKLLLTNLFFNFIIKPDFIAYNHKYRSNIFLKIELKKRKKILVAWTIKTMEEFLEIKDEFDIFIFEGFLPKL